MKRPCGCSFADACTCPMGACADVPAAASILSEAMRLVSDDRAEQHGDFQQNCVDAARIARSMGVEIHHHAVAVVLLSVKLARMRQNPGAPDNYVDAAGYLQLLAGVRSVKVESSTVG